MDAPILSVVVSVYDNLPYLRDTMESVLSQDLEGMEVIVIDDVSTDGSYEYVSELAEKDGRIRLYRHDVNKGVHFSRLEGMEHATGKYLWFVDGDDTVVSGSCRMLVTEAERHNVDVFHFGTRIVNEGNIDERRLANMERFVAPYEGRLEGRAVFDGCFRDGLYKFSIWNKLYRTELLKKAAEAAERIPLTKAQDKYEYFVISYLAESYYGDPSLTGYEYHFGTGITGHNLLTIGQFRRYCDMSLVAEAAERFTDGMEDTACAKNRQELLADCVANWYRLKADDRSEGFDMMVSSWGGSDVVPLLAKRDWYDPGAVARAVSGSECLVSSPREVRTVATYYHKFTNGGVQRVISGLLRTWTDMGYEVLFITDEEPSDKDYPMPDSVRRVVIPSYFTTDRDNYAVRSKALHQVLVENHVDVLVDHAWISDTLLWDTLVCKTSGVAFVSYCHNIFAMLERNSRSSFASLSDIYRLMDGIVTLSDVDTRFWRNFNDNVHEFLNPLTFEPSSVGPAVPTDRTVLWLGRMSEEKKPKEAVTVFKKLKETVPDARMVMVGDGTPGFMKDLREFINRNGLTADIELPGYSEDVSEYYSKAAVFLCTSEFEGFLLTLSESLSYGVPCVLYDLPYLKMIREGRGFVTVPQRDSTSAAAELASLLTDEDRRSALGAAGREYMLSLEGFDYEGAWAGMFDAISKGVSRKDVDDT
ncbi:MAG: glycosyltransferase, partial [archaeon]|nr:glycosyltransferase [archaeon]